MLKKTILSIILILNLFIINVYAINNTMVAVPEVPEVPGIKEIITIQQNLINLFVGETEQLIYYISPVDLSDIEVIYESSNNDIATINNNGLITAKKEGVVTISVRSINNIMAKVNIYVSNPITLDTTRVYTIDTLVIQNYYIIGLLAILFITQLKNKKQGD